MIAIALSASVAACAPQSPEETPAAAAEEIEISRADTLEISLRTDGSLLMGGEQMTVDELGDRLGNMDPAPTLTVRAGIGVSYGKVEDLLNDLGDVLLPQQVARVAFIHKTGN